jgi:hypothetical protein
MRQGMIVVFEDVVHVSMVEGHSTTRTDLPADRAGLLEAARVLGAWMELEEQSDAEG